MLVPKWVQRRMLKLLLLFCLSCRAQTFKIVEFIQTQMVLLKCVSDTQQAGRKTETDSFKVWPSTNDGVLRGSHLVASHTESDILFHETIVGLSCWDRLGIARAKIRPNSRRNRLLDEAEARGSRRRSPARSRPAGLAAQVRYDLVVHGARCFETLEPGICSRR